MKDALGKKGAPRKTTRAANKTTRKQKRVRRTPEQLEALCSKIASYVNSHPGAPRSKDNGRFLAETTVGGVTDFRGCVVSAAKMRSGESDQRFTIITAEDETAVLDVLRSGQRSIEHGFLPTLAARPAPERDALFRRLAQREVAITGEDGAGDGCRTAPAGQQARVGVHQIAETRSLPHATPQELPIGDHHPQVGAEGEQLFREGPRRDSFGGEHGDPCGRHRDHHGAVG